jgi:hypothetical protein
MTHYLMSPKNSRQVAVAAFPPHLPLSAYALMSPVPEELLTVDEFPFDLTLKKVAFIPKGSVESDDLSGLPRPWADYQPNALAWPLVSARLRAIIDRHASGQERHEWVRVTVRPGTGAGRPYHVLRFREQLDVLHKEASVFWPVAGKPDRLVDPAFAQEKITALSVFPYPSGCWQIPSGLCVSEQVKVAAKREGLMGLNFEDLRIY